ncbi:MAG: methyltransferase [Polyangiaceae bacterium]
MTARGWLVLLAPMAAAAVLVAALGPPLDSWQARAGLLLATVGFLLLAWARFALGGAFSVAARATNLVTRGPYARLRHPIYVFSWFALFGLVLYFDVLLLLPILALIAAIQVVRARREERILEERFGDEFRAHRQQTWF